MTNIWRPLEKRTVTAKLIRMPKLGYNVQIATENQYIVNYGLYWRPTDYGTMIPFLKSFFDRYGFYSSEIVADSGYGSEQNYEYMFAQWDNI